MSFLVGLDLNDVQVQTDNGDTSTTAFTLDVASTTNAVAVYISGVRQLAGTDYSVAGTTITFTTAPPTGTNNIMYVYTKAAIVNVPADDSVTTAKIAAAAVTSSKIDSTVASTNGTNTFSAAQSGSITALSDGANISVDLSANNHFSVTLEGNRTLDNPSNIVAGTSGSFFITQDGVGSRTLSYGGYYDFASGEAPTLTTTAAAVDRIDYIARTTTSLHCVFTGNLS